MGNHLFVVAGHPLHGFDIIAHLMGADAVVGYYSVFLQHIHYLLLVRKAGSNPVFQPVHFRLIESLMTARNTNATASQIKQASAVSTIA
jgi:hypothetical protein